MTPSLKTIGNKRLKEYIVMKNLKDNLKVFDKKDRIIK